MEKFDRDDLAAQIATWIGGVRGMFKHPLQNFEEPMSYAQLLANPLLLRGEDGRMFNFAPPSRRGAYEEDPRAAMTRAFMIAKDHVQQTMAGKTLEGLFKHYHNPDVDDWDPANAAAELGKHLGIDPSKPLAEYLKKEEPPVGEKYVALGKAMAQYGVTVAGAAAPWMVPPEKRAEITKNALAPLWEMAAGLGQIAWELVKPPDVWNNETRQIDLEAWQKAGEHKRNLLANLLTFGGVERSKEKEGEVTFGGVLKGAAENFAMMDLAEQAMKGGDSARQAGGIATINLLGFLVPLLRKGTFRVAAGMRQIDELAEQFRAALPSKEVENIIRGVGEGAAEKGAVDDALRALAKDKAPEVVPPVEEPVIPKPPVEEPFIPKPGEVPEVPKAMKEAPKIGEEAPKAEEAMNISEEAPKASEEKVKIGEEAPKAGEEAPTTAEDARKAGAAATGVVLNQIVNTQGVEGLGAALTQKVLFSVTQKHPNTLEVIQMMHAAEERPLSHALLDLIEGGQYPEVSETFVRVLNQEIGSGTIRNLEEAMPYILGMRKIITTTATDLAVLGNLGRGAEDVARGLSRASVEVARRFDAIRHDQGFFRKLGEMIGANVDEAANVAAMAATHGVEAPTRVAKLGKLLKKAGLPEEEIETLTKTPEFVRATGMNPLTVVKSEDVERLVKEAGKNPYINPSMVIVGEDPFPGVPLKDVPPAVRGAVAWKRGDVEAMKGLVPERLPGVPVQKAMQKDPLVALSEGEPSEAMKWVQTLTASLQSLSAGFSLSHYRTASRNFTSAVLNSGMEVVSKALTGVASMGFNTSFGKGLLREAVDDLSVFVMGGDARKGLMELLDAHPGVKAIVTRSNWMLEKALSPALTDFLTPMQRKLLHGAEVMSRVVSMFNSVSDVVVKTAVVAADTESMLRKLGVEPMVGDDGRVLSAISTAAANPEHYDKLSRSLAYALDKGKRITFTMDPPKDTLMARALETMARYPMLKLLTTNFPRFVYNSAVWFMDHQLANAFNLFDPKFRKLLTSQDPIQRSLATRTLTDSMGGFMMFSLAYAQQEKHNPPKYYQIYMGKDEKTGNEMYFDFRNLGPYANFAFMAHLARVMEGKAKLNLTRDELFHAVTGLSRLDDQLATKVETIFRKLTEAQEGRDESFMDVVKELAAQPVAPFGRPVGMVVKDMVLPLMDMLGMQGPEWFTDVVGKPSMSQVPIDVGRAPMARALTPFMSPDAINKMIGDPADHVAYMTDIFAPKDNPFVGASTPTGRFMRMLGFQVSEYSPVQEALHQLGTSHHKYIKKFYNIPAERQYAHLVSLVFDSPAVINGELSPALKGVFSRWVPVEISQRIIDDKKLVTVGDVVAKLMLDEQFQNHLYNAYSAKAGALGYKVNREAIPKLVTDWFFKDVMQVADAAYQPLESVIVKDMGLPMRKMTLTGSIEMSYKDSLQEYFRKKVGGPNQYLEGNPEPPPPIDDTLPSSPIAAVKDLFKGNNFEAMLDAWDRAAMSAPPQFAVAMKVGGLLAKFGSKIEMLEAGEELAVRFNKVLRMLQEANPESNAALKVGDKLAKQAMDKMRGFLLLGARGYKEEAEKGITTLVKDTLGAMERYARASAYYAKKRAHLAVESGAEMERFGEVAAKQGPQIGGELRFLRDMMETKADRVEMLVEKDPTSLFRLANMRAAGRHVDLTDVAKGARVGDGEFLARARMIMSRFSKEEVDAFMRGAEVDAREYAFMSGKVRAAERLAWNKEKFDRGRFVKGLTAALRVRLDDTIADLMK